MGYRTNATVFGERPGTLRVTAERLTFTETGGEVLIDAPLSDLHSVHLAEMDTAVDLWHGSTRHRLVVPPGPGPTASPGAVRVTPLEIAQGVAGTAARRRWPGHWPPRSRRGWGRSPRACTCIGRPDRCGTRCRWWRSSSPSPG